MKRGVALYLVGSTVLVALAGCGRGWLSFEEREPWRREAEIACLKSGAVKPGPAITPIEAIEGPGICGADHPFKVTALGDNGILGYTNDLRPPAAIPQTLRNLPPYGRSTGVGYYNGPQDFDPSNGADARRGDDPDPPLPLHTHGSEPEEEAEADEVPPGVDPFAVPGARPPAAGRYGGGSRPDVYPQARPYPAAPDSAPPPLGPRSSPVQFAGATMITPAATLACPMVSALDQWIAQAVQPAAQRWFGQPVVEIKQISAYSCRGMNGQRGAPISEHAFGNALDIAAFTLADRRRIVVKSGWRGEPEEQGFLRDVQAAACEQFSTVLAPGSNVYHYDHIHVDLRRRRSGRGICKPAAVSGELVAQRARERQYSQHNSGRLGFAPDESDRDALRLETRLPRAIPGAD